MHTSRAVQSASQGVKFPEIYITGQFAWAY